MTSELAEKIELMRPGLQALSDQALLALWEEHCGPLGGRSGPALDEFIMSEVIRRECLKHPKAAP